MFHLCRFVIGIFTLFCFMHPNFHLGKKKSRKNYTQFWNLCSCTKCLPSLWPLSCPVKAWEWLRQAALGNSDPLPLSLDTICSFPLLGPFPSLNSSVQQSTPPIQWDVHSAIGAQGAFASFSVGRVTNHAHLESSCAAF